MMFSSQQLLHSIIRVVRCDEALATKVLHELYAERWIALVSGDSLHTLKNTIESAITDKPKLPKKPAQDQYQLTVRSLRLLALHESKTSQQAPWRSSAKIVEGWLDKKQEGGFRSWQRRYFILSLSERCILYQSSPESTFPLGQCLFLLITNLNFDSLLSVQTPKNQALSRSSPSLLWAHPKNLVSTLSR